MNPPTGFGGLLLVLGAVVDGAVLHPPKSSSALTCAGAGLIVLLLPQPKSFVLGVAAGAAGMVAVVLLLQASLEPHGSILRPEE